MIDFLVVTSARKCSSISWKKSLRRGFAWRNAVPMRGNEALNTLPWVVGGVNGLEGGACLSEGFAWDASAQEGEIQQRQGGCAGLGLIAVNQQGTRGGLLLRCESEKVVESVELEELYGRIDDVEVEVAGAAQGEVVRMVTFEAAGVADGALVAGGLAGMDDG